MRLIEINGIKLEIDERTAKTVEQYRVGDKIKVLIKSYNDTYNVYPGVIVGFSDFKDLPTIDVMYCDTNSWNAECFKFVYLTAKSSGVEIAPFNEIESMLDKEDVVRKMDTAIANKERELADMKLKREYFITRFATAFEVRGER